VIVPVYAELACFAVLFLWCLFDLWPLLFICLVVVVPLLSHVFGFYFSFSPVYPFALLLFWSQLGLISVSFSVGSISHFHVCCFLWVFVLDRIFIKKITPPV